MKKMIAVIAVVVSLSLSIFAGVDKVKSEVVKGEKAEALIVSPDMFDPGEGY